MQWLENFSFNILSFESWEELVLGFLTDIRLCSHELELLKSVQID